MEKKGSIANLILPLLSLVILILIGIWGFPYLFTTGKVEPKTAPKDTLPEVKTEVQVRSGAENIERGRYLSNHVLVCFECHTERDWNLFSGPAVEGKHGAGGSKMDEAVHPGKFYTPNITPAGLKDWTDSEIFRAITCGIGKEGQPLYAGMPSAHYNSLPQKEIEDIIAYLRNLEPIGEKTPPSIPNKGVMEQMKKSVMTYELKNVKPAPDSSNVLEYGAYLFEIASCAGCHSLVDDQGNYYKDAGPGGGFAFQASDRTDTVRGANITPDVKTGIGSWSKEQFVKRFKFYTTQEGKTISAKDGEYFSPMPWTMYGGMSAQDLGAIYTYLMSLEPQEHSFVRYAPATSSKK